MTKLDIISDPICPWCYIGKSRLDRALENRPGHDIEIEWHPYMLNPEMPAEGQDRREYLETKFGGKKGAINFYGQIAEAAVTAGLDVKFDLITRTPNTVDAHRLIHWAGLEGVQTAVVSKLFKAYFGEGRDISDHEVLIEIGASASIDLEVVQKLFAQDVDKDGIKKRARNAAEKGVRGVPCFIVDNHYVIQGAQPHDFWEKVIDEIIENAKNSNA